MQNNFNTSISVSLLGLGILLFTGCNNESAISLTGKKYSVQHTGNTPASFFQANELGQLGLIELADFGSHLKEDIESIEVRYADLPSKDYDGKIVLIDGNRNGQFEYDSVDIIGLASFDKVLNFSTFNKIRSNRPLVIKIEQENYKLTFSNDGTNLELVPVKDQDPDLVYPFRLPEIKAKRLTKNAVIDKKNGKPTYIEFWGTWCRPCLDLVPELRALRKDFENQLNLTSINYRDKDMTRVDFFIRDYKMNWDHLVADETLMKEFGSPGFVPCGILFDSEGNLVQYGISPEEVRSYLQAVAL